MSALNGDKARFQRLRKATLRRRARSRLTQAALRLAAAGLPPGPEEPVFEVDATRPTRRKRVSV